MLDAISSLVQGGGLWTALWGPILYFLVVGPILGIVVYLLTRDRDRDE